MHFLLAVLSMMILWPGALRAQAPQFIFPVDCNLDDNCWVVNYPDVAMEEGVAQDYRCNAKTYDDHKGTDFAARSMAEVRAGIDVFAVRDGRVLRTRDGESDSLKTEEQKQAIIDARRECGNAVLIDHGQSLSSIYCHLRAGSVTVKPGDEIKAGDKIAQLGHSGLADFPHLHVGMTWEGRTIDPFTGLSLDQGCGKFDQNLWSPDLDYVPFSLYDGGFSPGVPDFEAIKNGAEIPSQIPQNSEAFVFWGAMYGVEKGDQVRLEVRDPDGALFADRDVVQDKTRARQYYYTGRTLKTRTLKTGTYTGRLILNRNGVQRSLVKSIEIVAP